MSVDSERAFGYNWVIPNRVGRRRVNVPARDTGKVGFPMHGDSTPSLVVVEVKTCTTCGEPKLLSEFGRRGHRLSACCKPCWAAKSREQARRDPDATRERHARFKERHPERRRAQVNASVAKARATWEQRLADRADSFWALVEMSPAGCWLWTGRVGTTGYGLFPLGSIHIKAHRAAYALVYEDPGEMFVCHHCDNPLCVRPDHLFLGTNNDNINDAVSKGRMHPGERTGGTLLSPDVVVCMRDDYASGMSFQSIADKYGVTYGCARSAVIGRTWRHVPGAVPPRKAHETMSSPGNKQGGVAFAPESTPTP